MPGPNRRHVVILNPLGLHLRAASKFAQLARQFQADVRVRRDDRDVDGKSVLDLMMLSAECGTPLVIEAAGLDSEKLLTILSELIAAGFYETD